MRGHGAMEGEQAWREDSEKSAGMQLSEEGSGTVVRAEGCRHVGKM